MHHKTYRAFVVQQTGKGGYTGSILDKSVDDLPPGEVLIRVLYSSLNYKDALSASGNRGVTKNYPHTPGIDAAGVVEESISDDFLPGDSVIVTGYDLGMNTPGGVRPIHPCSCGMGHEASRRPLPAGKHVIRDSRVHCRSLGP